MEDTSEERKAGEGDWVCCNGAAGCSIEGAEGVLAEGTARVGVYLESSGTDRRPVRQQSEQACTRGNQRGNTAK